ncbi:MAG: DUF748 domain-containing protein [Pseudomonadota bacterium]
MQRGTVWKSILALLVLLALVAALSPVAARFYGISWLQARGSADADIEAVSMNFLSGIITVQGVVAGVGPGQTLRLDEVSIDPGWRDLVTGHLKVDEVLLKGAVIDVRREPDGRLTVGELVVVAPGESPPEEAPGIMPSFAIGRVALASVTVSFSDGVFSRQLHIDELALGAISTASPDASTSVSLIARMGDTDVNIAGDFLPLATARELDLKVVLDNLVLAEHQDVIGAVGVQDLAGRISLTADLRLLLAPEGIEIDVEGEATAADLQASMADVELAVDDFRLELAARFTERSGLTYSIQAGAEATGLRVGIRGQPRQLLRVGRLVVTDADLTEAGASLSTIVGTEIVLLEQYHEPGNRIDRFVLRGLVATLPTEAAPAQVGVDEVTLTGASVHLSRSADDKLLYAELPADLAAAAPPAAGQADEQTVASPAIIKVRHFGLESGSLTIRDSMVQPPLVLTLAPVNLVLQNYDSSQPDLPLLADLSISLGDFTRLTVTGQLVPLAEKPGADLAFDAAGLELPQFAAYLPGYDIKRGRLNVTGEARVDQGKLNVTNNLVLEDLQLTSKAGQEVPALSDALAMPLDVALDLLRNSKDEIHLSIPVTGDLASPQFDFDDVVSSAIGGAMQKAALSYAKSLLQPLGTILFVADIAGKAARPRFEPVAFEPGSAELNDKGREYLGKMATLLAGRPGLRVSACGVASPADREALQVQLQASAAVATDSPQTAETSQAQPDVVVSDTALVELANRRGEQVRRFLITDQGLAQARIFSCVASVETSDDPGPRVKLLL